MSNSVMYGNSVMHERSDNFHTWIEWLDEDGMLHNEDGPAIVFDDGIRMWYRHGKLHREDGPAIEGLRGMEEWWLDDKRHRDDGPAITWNPDDKEWWKNGELIKSERYGHIQLFEV